MAKLYGRRKRCAVGDGISRMLVDLIHVIPASFMKLHWEGVVLFILLYLVQRTTHATQHYGRLSGLFLVGYAIARTIAECFREPEFKLGFWHLVSQWGRYYVCRCSYSELC